MNLGWNARLVRAPDFSFLHSRHPYEAPIRLLNAPSPPTALSRPQCTRPSNEHALSTSAQQLSSSHLGPSSHRPHPPRTSSFDSHPSHPFPPSHAHSSTDSPSQSPVPSAPRNGNGTDATMAAAPPGPAGLSRDGLARREPPRSQTMDERAYAGGPPGGGRMTNIAAQQPHWQPDTTGPGYGKRSVFLDLARRDLERGGTGAGAERVFSALVDTGDASLGRRPAWLKAWAALASCVSCVCTGIEQTARVGTCD